MSYNATTALQSPRTITGRENGAAFSFATAMTYHGAGQPLTIDPPGYGTTDVTTYTYAVPNRNSLLPDTRVDPLIGTSTFGYDGELILSFCGRCTSVAPRANCCVRAWGCVRAWCKCALR